ncbi:MAG TPA: hypothetical protein VGJ78_03340 [Vicinamibacterales bacterium]|jgi:hypothetical protein
MITTAPLFYSRALNVTQLAQYALGVFEPPAVDVVEFDDQDGGVVERELAVPFLRGMDSVVVENARLQLRSKPREMEIDDFQVSEPGGQPGIVVRLPRISRLLKIAIDFTVPPEFAAQTVRIVVRNAQPQQTGGFTFSPPVYAAPHFDSPGPMFSKTLTGLSRTNTSTGAVLSFPRPLGEAWLMQLATGDDAVKLNAIAVNPTVRYVRIDAVPQNLTLAIRLADESPQLWSHPQLFLPEAGVQDVDFSPLAQKRLSEVLKQADPKTAVTLSLGLEFKSDSGGDVSIASRTLDARYHVDAIGAGGQNRRLGGDWTALDIDAPAALRPVKVAADITVRPTGRELNGASPEPPLDRPSRGIRIQQNTLVAGATSFTAPVAERLADSPLVSARVYVSSRVASEVVLELRADAAGAPGAPIAPPVVRQLEPGFSGWAEFELESPWTPPAAQVDLWACLRTNLGEVLWYTAPGEESGAGRLVSLDRGASWGAADEALALNGPLLVQLFHSVPDPQPEPTVRLHRGGSLLSGNLLRAGSNAPVRQGPREFVLQGASLPDAVSNLLASAQGSEKVTTAMSLFSRAVADLQITRLLLEYDPFQASATGN